MNDSNPQNKRLPLRSALWSVAVFGLVLWAQAAPWAAEPASIQEETLVEPAARSLESAAAYQYIRAYQGEILGDFGSPQSVGALSTIIPDSTHAQSSGLATATDAGARRFARENG